VHEPTQPIAATPHCIALQSFAAEIESSAQLVASLSEFAPSQKPTTQLLKVVTMQHAQRTHVYNSMTTDAHLL
jgi:hypothetical protein